MGIQNDSVRSNVSTDEVSVSTFSATTLQALVYDIRPLWWSSKSTPTPSHTLLTPPPPPPPPRPSPATKSLEDGCRKARFGVWSNNTPGTGLRHSYVLLDGQAGRPPPPPPNSFPSPVTRVWRMGAGKRGLEYGLTALQALVYNICLPWWFTLLHSYSDQSNSP